jgi:hypothetical protein
MQKALAELKPRVMSNIEEGRRLLGLDMIVKTASGEPATENNTPVLKLYRMVHIHLPPPPMRWCLGEVLRMALTAGLLLAMQHQDLAAKDTTPGASKDAEKTKPIEKNVRGPIAS